MRSSRSLLVLALASACAYAPAQTVTPSPSVGSGRGALQPFVDSLIDVPDFRSAHWGILIVDPTRGETLYARNADKLFMPASNMKLVTAAVSLAQLGGDFRWTTTVLARGAVRDGALIGDVLIRGNGDPSISTHMQRGDALAPLRALTDSLRARGIARIRG
ncbi:MAG TPA: D-alanyl-D-alanine carboxypeptidase, partial [Gemmatimonadaceae bacterium]